MGGLQICALGIGEIRYTREMTRTREQVLRTLTKAEQRELPVP
jgi:hypothetical protein